MFFLCACSEERESVGKLFVPTRNKLVFVIRAGPRPRRIARKLLNKRTAADFDILLTQLARDLDVDTGTIKKIYTIYSRPVITVLIIVTS